MRFLAVAIVFLMIATQSCAAVPACASDGFNPGKYDGKPADPLPLLPSGFAPPIRGAVAIYQGLFINEGHAEWWVVDIDRGEATNIIFRSSEYSKGFRPAGYKIDIRPNGFRYAVRTIKLTDEQLAFFICSANPLWSRETQSQNSLALAAWHRKLAVWDQKIAAWKIKAHAAIAWKSEFAAWQRQWAVREEALKRWGEETARCPKLRDCAGPRPDRGPPPPRPPPLPPPPPPPPPPPTPPPQLYSVSVSADLAPATDVYNSVALVDGNSRRDFGGPGNLRGGARQLVDWLAAIFNGVR